MRGEGGRKGEWPPRSVKRFGLTGHVSRYASYGNVSGPGRGQKRKKKATGQRARWKNKDVPAGETARVETDREDAERKGKKRKREREREKYITSAARTDVIFIPGPGRGQRGHQRTADE